MNSKASRFYIKPAALVHARGSNSRTRRRQAFKPSPSPALPSAFPVVVITSKRCSVELLSCSTASFNLTFTTRASAAAERGVHQVPVQLGGVRQQESSQSFHEPLVQASSLPARSGFWLTSAAGSFRSARAALHPTFQCARR